MRAVMYDEFQGPLRVATVADPTPTADGVVIGVRATGLCRSDWHGWMGHDPDIRLPHVPGHELAGGVVAKGAEVKRWRVGDRVTVPFCVGCGDCEPCRSGNLQICDRYFQPGFTAWGSFAEQVAIPRADLNLVRLPDALDDVAAASLGCRYVTSFRAVVNQGRVQPGQWVAIHGCGGVGLAAIQIAVALGARVIGVDLQEPALQLAREQGAEHVIDAARCESVTRAIRDLTGGGAHVSIDALGSHATCSQSIRCLRKQGRHVQIGLMVGQELEGRFPMGYVIARELEIVGSHGMSAQAYGPLLDRIVSGELQPQRLIARTISLNEVPELLPQMGQFAWPGIAVVDRVSA